MADQSTNSVQFSVNVTATSVEEACQKIKAAGYAKSITSVGVFNAPVLNSSPLLDPTKDTHFIFDVTPTLATCSSCCDLLATEDLDELVGGFAEAENVSHPYYQTSGSMRLSKTFAAGAKYNFIAPGAGIIFIKSQNAVKSSAYHASMSGRVGITGLFKVVSPVYVYQFSGKIRISGHTQLGFSYAPSGRMSLRGATSYGVKLPSVASGVMKLRSAFHVVSSNFTYRGSGIMSLRSNFGVKCSDMGVIDIDTGGEAEVQDQRAGFAFAAAPVTLPITTGISADCCVSPIPSFLELKHNLSNLQLLSNFLKRNGLTLDGGIGTDTFIPLQYRPKVKTWQGSIYLIGLSTTSNSEETWNLTFEFTCTDEVGGSSLSSSNWVFTLNVKRQDLSRSNSYRARLVSVFTADEVCSTAAPFDSFGFTFDIQNQETFPANESVIFHDESGLFANSPSFIADPSVTFLISVGLTGQRQTYDWSLEEQRYAVVHVADSTGHPL
jgi:hypothetical protein